MKARLFAAVCTAALILSATAAVDSGLSPAMAQEDISFQSFHDQLASYGDWVYSDRWGEVWIPGDVPDDFRPYGTDGHWVYTDDYGWYWVSDYDWGDIPFHYGRWVNDPDDGWLWIPGYVWGPGWVIWRHNGEYTGWMPMPPDDSFLGYGPETNAIGISIGGLFLSFNSGDDYGYRRWYGPDYGEDRFASNWIFIGTGHMGDRDYRRYEAPRRNYVNIIHNTTNITNYTVVNNHVVNRSVDPNAVRKAGGQVLAVKIADVVKKPQLITSVDAGRKLQMRAREMRPHGNGMANSAPMPTSQQIQSLSKKMPRVHGKAPVHLFTRQTVTKAPLTAKPTLTTPMTGKPSTMQGPALSPKSGVMVNPPATNAGTPLQKEIIKGRKPPLELQNKPNVQAPGGAQTTTTGQPVKAFGKATRERKIPVTPPTVTSPPPTTTGQPVEAFGKQKRERKIPVTPPTGITPPPKTSNVPPPTMRNFQRGPAINRVVPNVQTVHPVIERPVKPPKVEVPRVKTEAPPPNVQTPHPVIERPVNPPNVKVPKVKTEAPPPNEKKKKGEHESPH